MLPEEQTRPDVARRRARWKAYQGRIAPQRLVFIDETSVKTNMAPPPLGVQVTCRSLATGWKPSRAATRREPSLSHEVL